VGASSGLAEATDLFNRAQIKSLAEFVRQHHSDDTAIGILGLTYKPDTDVVEEAFGLLLAQELSVSGLHVIVYDPSADVVRALGSFKNVRCAISANECIEQSGVAHCAADSSRLANELRIAADSFEDAVDPGVEHRDNLGQAGHDGDLPDARDQLTEHEVNAIAAALGLAINGDGANA